MSYRRKPDPPSIPSPGQAYGFEEGTDGNLQRQKIPDRDTTLGPAFYKINFVRELYLQYFVFVVARFRLKCEKYIPSFLYFTDLFHESLGE